MCSKNIINHDTKKHTWTLRFKMETQFGRKPPLLSSLSSIFIIKKTAYNIVLAQNHTSTQAPTCRRLQPSLLLQLLLEGSSSPLMSFTNYHWKGATTPSLKASTLSTTADHVSSIFTLDPTASTQHYLQAYFLQIFGLVPLHTFKL